MKRAVRTVLAALVALSTPGAASAAVGSAPAPLPVPNPSFEEPSPSALPAGWTLGESAKGVTRGAARRDPAASAGSSSLLLENASPASTTVVSEPVALEVGRAYRLSASMRTEGAVSDPLSRYPTGVAACLTMESFPFTNHSPALGGTRDFTRVETVFLATASRDRVRLHLGRNGTATGKAWFDDVSLAPVEDVAELIPPDRVRWFGDGYRYEEKGWVFVHVEGEPYPRGYQHGFLLSEEIVAYAQKLAIQESPKDPPSGWTSMRTMADALFLRGFDEELLTEMKGIADGAAKAGAKIDGRPVDLLDVVTLNSAVDLGQVKSALRSTPHALTGKSFLSAEDEMKVPDEKNKCSALAATGPATKDGRVVFGQIFMWSGYTGVHFNVLLDVVPAKGHRLVFQTFPGGIHSGTDFYMNDAGILIGETTVAQTPFDPTGTPQSDRIRRAAQYASSVDDVVKILKPRNNGLYTNDWPIADVKRNEAAIYLLGTKRDKLWRSTQSPAPFGTPGFLWANNNARDPLVREEYAVQSADAPFDAVFSAWNRDVAFLRFYEERKGKIDVNALVELWASSPVNRPHACDGKVTDAEMASRLVFMAHHGKVTLREKFPQAGSRRMPDLPGALPHLSLGYATFSPIWITQKLKEARGAGEPAAAAAAKAPTTDAGDLKERYEVEKRRLWRGSVFPATDGDGWLVSGSAAYWQLLHGLPEGAEKAEKALADQLASLSSRLEYVLSREEDVVPAKASRAYDRYGPYQIPRVKGTFALHQLRLRLGNAAFLKVMDALHTRYGGKEVTTAAFLALAREVSGKDVAPWVRPWIDRGGVPDPRPKASVTQDGAEWVVTVEVNQAAPAWPLLGTVSIETGTKRLLKPYELKGERDVLTFRVPERPRRVVFDASRDVPAASGRFYAFASFSDDFDRTRIVHGTSRQIEANRTLALRIQTTLADAYSEILSPVVKDGEATDAELAAHDLIVLGSPEENGVAARVAATLPGVFGDGYFRWNGKTYARGDEGLFLVLPNPWNPKRALALVAANSALQLHEMTKAYVAGIPGWAVFRGAEVKEQGPHPVERFVLDVPVPPAGKP